MTTTTKAPTVIRGRRALRPMMIATTRTDDAGVRWMFVFDCRLCGADHHQLPWEFDSDFQHDDFERGLPISVFMPCDGDPEDQELVSLLLNGHETTRGGPVAAGAFRGMKQAELRRARRILLEGSGWHDVALVDDGGHLVVPEVSETGRQIELLLDLTGDNYSASLVRVEASAIRAVVWVGV